MINNFENLRLRKRRVRTEERELGQRHRASKRAERQDRPTSCFWVWPWGHVFNSLVCRVCGKNTPNNRMKSGW